MPPTTEGFDYSDSFDDLDDGLDSQDKRKDDVVIALVISHFTIAASLIIL